MTTSTRSLALLALGLGMASISNAIDGTEGSAKTTRYWDCCKPSCAWPDKFEFAAGRNLQTCNKSDKPLTPLEANLNAVSGCDADGESYMPSDQVGWAVNDNLAYGFAAVGGAFSENCCACYELTFTSTDLAGKKMIVQATNSGTDLAADQFDIAMPGSGFGIFNGCSDQWGADPNNGDFWGAEYGGMSSDECSKMPAALKPGCEFRFGWFKGADNPNVDWKKVACPAAITEKSNCLRADDNGSAGEVEASPAETKPATTAAQQPSAGAGEGAGESEGAGEGASESGYESANPPKPTDAVVEPVQTDDIVPIGTTLNPEPTLPVESPEYGATSSVGVSYGSAVPSGGSEASPVGGDDGPDEADEGECAIEYVYVDEI